MTPELTRDDVSMMILSAKKQSGMSWEGLAEEIGMSPVWTHAASTGMAAMPKEKAELLGQKFNLSADAIELLQEPPSKDWNRDVPTAPCIYRLYEICGVYGPTFKALVHEKFGDGIMSAIDFDMHVDRVEHPKGDRVKVTMTGKFLAYNTW
ncbi:MAG: cyanase [Sphingomonadales bacterium]